MPVTVRWSPQVRRPWLTAVVYSLREGWRSYGYSNPIGYQTSDFRLLWTITPNPQPPKPPMIGLCPPPHIRHALCPPYETCPPPFSLAQFCTLLP